MHTASSRVLESDWSIVAACPSRILFCACPRSHSLNLTPFFPGPFALSSDLPVPSVLSACAFWFVARLLHSSLFAVTLPATASFTLYDICALLVCTYVLADTRNVFVPVSETCATCSLLYCLHACTPLSAPRSDPCYDVCLCSSLFFGLSVSVCAHWCVAACQRY